MKILLVEDNPGDARLLQEMLKEADAAHYQLTLAERLADALQRISEGAFDVILLDLALPDSHGIETFNEIHRQAPSVPVVVLSGFDDTAFATEVAEAGALSYLNKNSVESDILVQTINDAIARGRSQK
jgi:two-component system cell cycle sensor histidine kinase/response regulator CckA